MLVLWLLLRTEIPNSVSNNNHSIWFRYVYHFLITIALVTVIGTFLFPGAAYIVLNPEYAKPTHRGARTKVFIGLGLSAVLPVSHCFVTHGFNKLFAEMGFGWLIASGGLYISGALI